MDNTKPQYSLGDTKNPGPVQERGPVEQQTLKDANLDGRTRGRVTGERKAVIFRMPLEKKRKLHALAEGLDMSYSDVMSAALDVYEAHMKGQGKL